MFLLVSHAYFAGKGRHEHCMVLVMILNLFRCLSSRCCDPRPTRRYQDEVEAGKTLSRAFGKPFGKNHKMQNHMPSGTLLYAALTFAGLTLILTCKGDRLGRGVGGGSGDVSDLTSINIGLPDRERIKGRVTDLDSYLNAYQLTIKPVVGSCVNGARIDQVGNYTANPVLSTSIQQGCDYLVTLRLGKKKTDAPNTSVRPSPVVSPTPSPSNAADSGAKLQEVYYQNNLPLNIKKSEIQNKASYRAKINLQLQPAGKLIGLSDGTPPGQGTPTPEVSPPPNPDQTIQGEVQIPADRDYELKSESGASSTLSKLFKGKYLLLGFVSSLCESSNQADLAPCTNSERSAASINGSQATQALFADEKCSLVFIADGTGLTNWLEKVGLLSFSGTRSFESNDGSSVETMLRQLAGYFNSTPTFVFLNPTGSVVGTIENVFPTSQAEVFCK
jgi:hypothetical protein